MGPAGSDDLAAIHRRHARTEAVPTLADEIAGLPADVKVFHVEQLTVPGLDAERCIVWMQPV